MRSALFWTILPFTLPQALRVRRTAPRFAAAAGDTRGRAGAGDVRRLLAVGDSIIAGVGARRVEQALVGCTAQALAARLGAMIEWEAVGSIGATSAKLAGVLLDRLPPVPADFVIVSIGVNDVTSLATRRAFTRRLDGILRRLRAHSPHARIGVAGIPPLGGFPLLPQPLRALFGLRGSQFDIVIRRVVGRHDGVVHVPLAFDASPARFADDGFHPSEASYREFADAVVAGLLPKSVGAARPQRHM